MIYWKQIKEFKKCKHGFKYRDIDLFDKWVVGKGITYFVKISNGDRIMQNELIALFPTIEDLLRIPLVHIVWDHMVLFKNKGTGEIWLTSQPYSNFNELMKFKDDHADIGGIDIQIYDQSQSWYYPGVTNLVVINFTLERKCEKK